MPKIVRRYIGFYEKRGSKVKIGNIMLPDDSLEELRQICHPPEDDPLMYDCYFVDEKIAEQLTRKYGVQFVLKQYNYYVEAGYITIPD